ncbi:MAG: DUF5678 domain-containing protein [bacterium]|nr:DUF5678 domain-containing protein [bacterium]
MTKNATRTINLSKILKPFVNKWVAISPDYKKIISSGNTLQELVAKVGGNKKDLIFHKVMPLVYAPLSPR